MLKNGTWTFKTSYFAKYKELDGIAVSITVPEYWKGEIVRELNPPFSLLNQYKKGLITDSEYVKIFNKKVLDNLDILEIANKVNNKVMLCWEKSGKLCHRHIIAAWLKKNLNVEVVEL